MLPTNYADTPNYQIAKDLAVDKAKRHGKSTWPFVENEKEIIGVTAKKQVGGKITTALMFDKPKPGLFETLLARK